MGYLSTYLDALWQMSLEAGPWLLIGLIIAGLLKAYLREAWLARWLGGRGVRPIVLAGVVGTPVPLCSCSVVPAALTLRRGGASRGATASFLIATPENGADSIALSYALLGPFMTVVRPVAALATAVATGLATQWGGGTGDATDAPDQACCAGGSCCGDGGKVGGERRGGWQRLIAGMRYAMLDLFSDIAGWLVLGLLIAAGVTAFAPPDVMSQWGSGLGAMLLMLLIGVPMYICATASTPVAAAMLLAGVSPGTVLVFLLAGPATNLGTVGILRRELGTRSAAIYVGGIAVMSVLAGLATDWLVGVWGVNVAAQAAGHEELIPRWLALASLAVLGALLVRVLWQKMSRRLSAPRPTATPQPEG